MRYESLQRLAEQTKLPLHRGVGQIPEFSHVKEAAHLGALRRNQLCGNPGTPEGRRLGGLRSMERRWAAARPGLPMDRFVFAKVIKYPTYSPQLAEFIGMMLGDGCLCSAYQAAFYFNTETDAQYAKFMEKMAYTLFQITPTWDTSCGGLGGALIFSSKLLVDYLIALGFGRGDKVKTQAGVPAWILEDRIYRENCLRGLMDTDGSVYQYRHRVYGKHYVHTAICFTNRSHPLLRFVEETLRTSSHSPTTATFRVYLYRRGDVERYFSHIGSHNAKHLTRYSSYSVISNGFRRGGSSPVEGAALEKR